MQAWTYRRFGSPDVLERVEVEPPSPAAGQVLVRVRATGINPYDLHFLGGDPYLMRPMLGLGIRRPRTAVILGSDVAGVVEAVGSGVTRYRIGDEVCGTAGRGGLGELVAVAESSLAAKPESSSFEEAAAVPMAATTALQALRDAGKLEPGMQVLVNGASGGVGSYAVQLAKALGAADVTAVCSTRNIELVRSIGADRAIDYSREDFTREGRRYDMVVDTIGNRSTRAFCRPLVKDGTFVVVGGGGGGWLGPLRQIVGAKLSAPFVSQRVALVMARTSGDDVASVLDFVAAGRVRPVIDRTYPFAEAPDALRHLATRHARGKVVIAAG